jgi:hypothetical protein
MNRQVAAAAGGAAAVLVMGGCFAGGWLAHGARTVTRTVPHVVTVTRTAPPKVVTRTVPGAPSLPCQDIGGSPEPGVITPGLPGDTTCTVTLDSPMGASHLAQITLTAPNGDAAIWNLANPNG